ncbi:MAG TPA: formylglycine-generating enzyme family protein [Verrucomicrobiota bacterium]|nr:formylglycine-generating enzyme family protein [Verrucomicrobiota bacterium]
MNRTWSMRIGCLAAAVLAASAMAGVVETEREFFGTGDFDGNGRVDVVIHDKATGKYRLGYQGADGGITWVNYRASGVKDATGIATGRLFDPQKDGLVITAADANQVVVVGAADTGSPSKPEAVAFETLGPAAVLAVDVGGAGNTPLDDLAIGSIYNEPNKLTLLRNNGSEITVFAEPEIKMLWSRPARVVVKKGGPAVVAGLWAGDEGETFRLADFGGGKEAVLAEAGGFAKESDYVVGFFRGGPLAEVAAYVRGGNAIEVAALEEAGGKLKLGARKSFDLGKPIKVAVAVPAGNRSQLLVLFGKGETAEVYEIDVTAAPKPVQAFAPAAGDALFGAVAIEKSFLVFSGPDYSKFSMAFEAWEFSGAAHAAGAHGKLASMADNDDATVPDIQKRLVETLAKEGIKAAADMKAYTNTIPGSTVNYVMLPIPGGEFLMGSPEAEAGRNADESPQRRVKVAPFWIGRCEVTWNEYELFMYPDDEKKLRLEIPTEDYVNQVSDAVTRPSKPYMEMSFGMGKEGYPAISMTQHAANKYCHWLSAKTGHYYRLPTEAEWEYACRAGTTTAYSFGGDAALLGEHAWFEDNADFKYQKVGRKKPNAWGLYDMHGNVAEWCLDQYEDSYARIKDLIENPWNRAAQPYPQVARGGSFDDSAAKLRSAARRGSDRSWKMRDPQLPKSIWWLTDAPFLGFRVVRPLAVPPPAELQKYWTSGVEKD